MTSFRSMASSSGGSGGRLDAPPAPSAPFENERSRVWLIVTRWCSEPPPT
eukprot:CAMPEP_0119481740 /NCGR_PEP_ID=MMETSP1344-20130328/9932_1 /TAXON_ID=236787 /ORGANISM="Florenciella parvula, Strain CCMP2471" /LENGTH=49 /DNA_ID= /DNA_START= /DNA_END= /DNA_ORIENTATION=